MNASYIQKFRIDILDAQRNEESGLKIRRWIDNKMKENHVIIETLKIPTISSMTFGKVFEVNVVVKCSSKIDKEIMGGFLECPPDGLQINNLIEI